MEPTDIIVDEFTTPYPFTVNENTMVDELRELMGRHGIRHLPVVRGEVVVGMTSGFDVRLVTGLSHTEKMQVQAGDLMRTDLVFVSADVAPRPCAGAIRRVRDDGFS